MADPFGTLTGAIGLFNTCLHAYRAVATAIEIGSDSFIWDVMMRIERTRFEIWGRTLGFLDEATGAEKTADENGLYPDEKMAEIMDVEVARDLVVDILKSIDKTLKDFQLTADKYHLHGNSDSVPPARSNDAVVIGKGRSERKRERLKKAWENTRDFTGHLWLVVKDEGMVDDLLQRLAKLNDGLDKLYSASQRAQSIRALSSGVLSEYDEVNELSTVSKIRQLNTGRNKTTTTTAQRGQSVDRDDNATPSHYTSLATTARVKQMCIETSSGAETERLESSEEREQDHELKCFEIPAGQVRVHEIPQIVKSERFWPLGSATYTPGKSSSPIEVLVEWRMPYPMSAGSFVNHKELERRRDLIVHLLHRTSNLGSSSDYRILDCIGYIKYTGRVDGNPQEVIGFLSLLPQWAEESTRPVTLQKLLSDSFDAVETGTIPSLHTRLAVARSVSNALYQLQCSRWLHRSLTSHNIVFFTDRDTEKLRLSEPFLIGLQYSRPDDQPEPTRSVLPKDESNRLFTEGVDIGSWGSLSLYLHPDHSTTDRRRYKRSDDIYSLGIILFELAFWEPIRVFAGEVGDDGTISQNVSQASKSILRCAKAELASEVGEIYRNATLKCLMGLRKGVQSAGTDNKAYSDGTTNTGAIHDGIGAYDNEDPEIGLEDELLWKVIREIEKCRV